MAVAKELSMLVVTKSLKAAGFVLFGLVVLGGLAVALGAVPAPWDTPEKMDIEPPPKAALGVQLVKGKPHTLQVPRDVRIALGIRQANDEWVRAVQKPARTQPLVMPGSTRLDTGRLLRIRARFAPAELIEIGKDHNEVSLNYGKEIRNGSRVKKDDLLGVFYSDVVGNKKNDLVDAILQIVLDHKILKRAEANTGVLPEVFIWNAQRNVQGDLNAINRAMSTLKTWGVPEDDIRKLVGQRIYQAIKGTATWDILAKDVQALKDKAKDTKEWGRIELKSPIDGVLIERNVALNELVQDPTVNIFQIANVDRLTVLANVPEDDLPKLHQLRDALARRGEPMRWVVQTVGSPRYEGVIDDIGYVLDPNQHTAVVTGHIDNPKELLRAGQFISATVELLPPDDVVEVPMDALVEDGQQAIVFVQTDRQKHHYTMRRVHVTHRFEKRAFVQTVDKSTFPVLGARTVGLGASPFGTGPGSGIAALIIGWVDPWLPHEDKEQGLLPKEPLYVGERVLLRGAVELKAALLDKESQRP
jgi:cobalt-zinc-cadmium efflux system membrane fusion protein